MDFCSMFMEGEESHRSKRWANDNLHIRIDFLMSEEINHKDILGNTISVEDTVVVPTGRRDLKIGVVKKLSPKMITVTTIGRNGRTGSKLLYPGDVLVVNDPKVTMYMLKHQPK